MVLSVPRFHFVTAHGTPHVDGEMHGQTPPKTLGIEGLSHSPLRANRFSSRDLRHLLLQPSPSDRTRGNDLGRAAKPRPVTAQPARAFSRLASPPSGGDLDCLI